MSDPPEFEPLPLLERLCEGGVEFVVVGGFAAVAHGSARVTFDLDIVLAPDTANLERLGRVLIGLGARLRGVEDAVPFVPDARTLRNVQLLTLDTPEGPLDVMVEPDGCPSWRQLRRDAVELDLGGVTVPVASLPHLMAMKRAAGRDKDLKDLEELEVIARLRERR